ncbi:MAG: glycosyltransferase [Pyrinomonadaceae bacterium]
MASAISSDDPLTHEYIGDAGGWDGARQFIRKCLRADVVILNTDQEKLALACLLRWLLPMVRFKLVSVDLILRTPKTTTACLKALIKRILFLRVDRFILYFKDIRGYERHYGITPKRAAYIPFKVNGWENISSWPDKSADGDYVLCAGRTLRDIETFVEAMRRVNCPGVLLQQKRELLAAHGTSAWSGELPPNLKLIVDEGDRLEDYLNFIAKARLMVIPRFRDDIAPTGISTYLVAMALNKCVIISEGPGANDVLTDQAVIIPTGEAGALAQQIELLWNDQALRSDIAARGNRYAHALEGEQRLFSDILRVSLAAR